MFVCCFVLVEDNIYLSLFPVFSLRSAVSVLYSLHLDSWRGVRLLKRRERREEGDLPHPSTLVQFLVNIER